MLLDAGGGTTDGGIWKITKQQPLKIEEACPKQGGLLLSVKVPMTNDLSFSYQGGRHKRRPEFPSMASKHI
jgi:hypothetical protein